MSRKDKPMETTSTVSQPSYEQRRRAAQAVAEQIVAAEALREPIAISTATQWNNAHQSVNVQES